MIEFTRAEAVALLLWGAILLAACYVDPLPFFDPRFPVPPGPPLGPIYGSLFGVALLLSTFALAAIVIWFAVLIVRGLFWPAQPSIWDI